MKSTIIGITMLVVMVGLAGCLDNNIVKWDKPTVPYWIIPSVPYWHTTPIPSVSSPIPNWIETKRDKDESKIPPYYNPWTKTGFVPAGDLINGTFR
jgi:hypothetical protein